jgi:hypothetical protein
LNAAFPVIASTTEGSVMSLTLAPPFSAASRHPTPGPTCPKPCGTETTPGRISSLTSSGSSIAVGRRVLAHARVLGELRRPPDEHRRREPHALVSRVERARQPRLERAARSRDASSRDVHVDGHTPFEPRERLLQARAARRREHRVAGEDQHAAHLALARRRDLVRQAGDRQLAAHLGQPADALRVAAVVAEAEQPGA